MTNAFRCNASEVAPIIDPTTGMGLVSLFEEAFGQDGRPFVLFVEDPPNRTRDRHYHHGDVVYFYVRGEHTIEGEGTYRAGDLRWTRAGHVYGPETTGSEGGAWWVVSSQDPIPVNVPAGTAASTRDAASMLAGLNTFAAPFDWDAIDASVRDEGGVIVRGLVDAEIVARIGDEVAAWTSVPEAGLPESGSVLYDAFLGSRTARFHGLVQKAPTCVGLLETGAIIDWAERMLAPTASSILLNAGEFIQIGPGETAQYLHRDSDSWPIPFGEDPVIVNAIVALDAFTCENGATHVAVGSHAWEPHRQPTFEELARAVMEPGDTLLFRGDILHGGGANTTETRRRGLSLSFCAGWLRPVENAILNIGPTEAVKLPPRVAGLLGYASYDGTAHRGGMLGLYENGAPERALRARTGA